VIEQQAAAEVAKLKPKLSYAAAKAPLRPDLRPVVEQLLARHPEQPWDAALAELLA
jgi:hypothetical protein